MGWFHTPLPLKSEQVFDKHYLSTFSICGPWTLAGVARCALSRKNSYSVARPSLLGLATPDNVLPHPRLVPKPCLPHFQVPPKSPTLSPPTAPSTLQIIFTPSPGVATGTESCVQDARKARVGEQEDAHDQVSCKDLMISDCALCICFSQLKSAKSISLKNRKFRQLHV